jgi:hypothetical protein
MTEKDAVKCAALGTYPDADSARHDLWFLAVDAVVDAGLQSLIINLLNQRKSAKNGSKTA